MHAHERPSHSLFLTPSTTLPPYFYAQRYYGKSLPLGEASLTPPSIGYLTVEQALADYAVLIQSLKAEYTGIFSVVAFGGRYICTCTCMSRHLASSLGHKRYPSCLVSVVYPGFKGGGVLECWDVRALCMKFLTMPTS